MPKTPFLVSIALVILLILIVVSYFSVEHDISNIITVPGKNGLNGKDGAPGKDGLPGKDGAPGKDGLPGKNGLNGKDGLNGLKGDNGDKGDKGDKGDFGGPPGPQGIPGNYLNQTDFVLGQTITDRGDTGASRALVKDSGSKLVINWGDDFNGGVVLNAAKGLNINGPTIINNDLKVTGKIKNKGFFGPFNLLSRNDSSQCVDVGQGFRDSYNNTVFGQFNCTSNTVNPYQTFYYNPITKQLYNQQKDKCLDHGGNTTDKTKGTWGWQDCSNVMNQGFDMINNKFLAAVTGSTQCIDWGNSNFHSDCNDAGTKNQAFNFSYYDKAS